MLRFRRHCRWVNQYIENIYYGYDSYCTAVAMGEPIYYTCMAQMYQAGVQQLYAIHSNDVAAFESACGVPWEFGAQQYLQGTCIGYWNYLDALTQVLSNTDDQFVAWCSC